MIDARAIIDPKARIGNNVSVGPYAVIGADVEIGDDTVVGPHTVIRGPTRIGKQNKIFQFTSLGDAPQDKKYHGEPTVLEIGDRNSIREFCTINRGTTQDVGVTRIGNDNWIMAYVHIAHDCQVGNHCTFANASSLAGHVSVGDYAILGGFTLVHQFCTLGAHSFTAMGSVIAKDVPTYVMVSGNPAHAHGLNSEGLKRRGFSAQVLQHLRRAYKVIYRAGNTIDQAQEQLKTMLDECPEIAPILNFLQQSIRGIVR
ncbi:MAG: acyl-ACP--UDP-N-acetylglucosamine O-acyltransferase [Pseudomonadota bacterium]